jgi:O-antigen/teichoic acid export membrane protein
LQGLLLKSLTREGIEIDIPMIDQYNHKSEFLNGIKWTTLQQVFTQIVGIVGLIVMTFLVTPDVFGVVAIATVWLGFFLLIQDFGIREHLVKDKEMLENTKREYFGVLVVGATISLVVYTLFGLVYIEIYSNLEHLSYALILLALLIIVRPLVIFYEGMRIREHDFKFIAINNIQSSALSNILGVTLAYLGYAIEAVIIKFLSGHVLMMAGYVFFSKERVAPAFNKSVWKKIWLFALNLTYAKILNYFSRNADYIVLGLFFSPSIVGQYSIAYKIMLLPMKNISSQVTTVLLPIMSKVQDQHEKLSRLTIKSLSGITFIIFPLMILLSGTSALWVNMFFPEEYGYIEEMVAVLCIVGAFQAIASPLGNLYIISGRTDVMLKTGIVKTFVMVSGFIAGGLSHDITIFMFIYIGLYVFIDMPVSYYYAFKVASLSLKELAGKVIIVLIPSLLLLIFLIIGASFGLEFTRNPTALLIFLVLTGVTLYLLIYQSMHSNSVKENIFYVKNILRNFKG